MTQTESFKMAVLRAFPPPPAWATAKQIFERMEYGSYNSIKQTLHTLAAEGKIAKFGPVMEPAFQRIDISPSEELKDAMALRRHKLAEWKRV